ncbi:MAG: Methionine synthase, vitamin-B12 independent, partial [uncultured Rubellimicrobium sp.]
SATARRKSRTARSLCPVSWTRRRTSWSTRTWCASGSSASPPSSAQGASWRARTVALAPSRASAPWTRRSPGPSSRPSRKARGGRD